MAILAGQGDEGAVRMRRLFVASTKFWQSAWGLFVRAGRHITVRRLCIFLILLFVVSIIPLLYIGRYAVPAADDYIYGRYAYQAFQDTGSFFAAVKGAVRQIGDSWKGWQGTYSAIFLMALQPAVFGADWYILTPIVLILSLTAGICLLCRAVLHRWLGAGGWCAGAVAMVLAFICVQLLPSPSEGFYWWNGAIYYTFSFAVMLTMFSLLIYYAVPNIGERTGVKRAQIFLLCGMAFFIGGTNYVTALNTAILYALALLLLLWANNRAWRWLCLPYAIFWGGFLFNTLAPGNAARQNMLGNTPSAVEAIVTSFPAAIRFADNNISLFLVGVLLALVPFLFWMAGRCKTNFARPGLVTLVAALYFVSCFTPTLYALGNGNTGAMRTHDLYFYTMVIVFVFVLFYWLGWVRRALERMKGENGRPLPDILLAPFSRQRLACLLLAAVALSVAYWGKASPASSSLAIQTLASGEAKAYAAQMRGRLALYEDPGILDVEVAPLAAHPWLIYNDSDITEDFTHWRNDSLMLYFRKNTIRVNPALQADSHV